ncbi:helix-turn-helix domain-containing protein [Bradyrhizobium sp. DASA03007]|uniref:helix-turn-helix domain-containing protein n=1 Tax=unclassified Bradyrhizobium TaxID=2631580 RepID=UPI003F6E7800
MSWQATAWAVRQKVEPPARKLLLLVIATYADEHGICWPSQETLSEDTGMSLDTIQRHTKKLKEEGFLSITRPPKRRGQWQTFVYQLSMPAREARSQDALRQHSSFRSPHTKPNAQRGNRRESHGEVAQRLGGERRSPSVNLIQAADRLIEQIRSFEAVRDGVPTDCQAAARTIDADVVSSNCGMARPNQERQPGRTAMRPKPSIEPSTEPSGSSMRTDAGARLRAFQANQEPTEVTQNRIARRLGPEGWLLLGELSNAERERLTALERRHQLDDETLRQAVLRARSAR